VSDFGLKRAKKIVSVRRAECGRLRIVAIGDTVGGEMFARRARARDCYVGGAGYNFSSRGIVSRCQVSLEYDFTGSNSNRRQLGLST